MAALRRIRRYRNPRVKAFLKFHRRANPERLILQLVQGLLEKTNFPNPPPPFLPEVVGKERDVFRIERDADLLCDAVLCRESGGFVIRVNNRVSKGRSNFSCFHEIAHTFFIEAVERQQMRFTKGEIRQIEQNYDEEERLCDLAAAEFLMPAAVTREFLAKSNQINWTRIRELSRRFGSSLRATALRVAELSDRPVLIEIWESQDAGENSFYKRRTLFQPRNMLRAREEVTDRPPHCVLQTLQTGQTAHGLYSYFLTGKHREFRIETISTNSATRRNSEVRERMKAKSVVALLCENRVELI